MLNNLKKFYFFLKLNKSVIIKRIAASLLLIVFIFLLQGYLPCKNIIAAPTQDELDNIKKEKEETKKKIEQAQKEQDAYAAQVEQVETKLLDALGDLEELNAKQAETKSRMDKSTIELISNEQDIKQVEQELFKKTELLNSRVAEIYKTNNRSILNVFLKTEDFIEFISRLKLMNLFLKKDIEIIDEIKEKKARLLRLNKNIIDLRDQLEQEKQSIEKLVGLSEDKKSEIELIYDEKSELFSEAKANKDALIAMENQLTVKEAEITNVLVGYEYGAAPSGKMLWPTNGRLSSGFGYRTSKSTGRQRMHNGIDIYAQAGTPVLAADSGQVIMAEYDGGYGYSILIYHGGGIASFYAHLSGFAVSPGQFVQKGQVIGYVGRTGFTTGPHLHFEVRVNGGPQNPNSYLF